MSRPVEHAQAGEGHLLASIIGSLGLSRFTRLCERREVRMMVESPEQDLLCGCERRFVFKGWSYMVLVSRKALEERKSLYWE